MVRLFEDMGTGGNHKWLDASLDERAALDGCPAFHANWAFHEGANLAPEGVSHSDIADLWHLPGTPYCDVAFVDKRTSEALREGKYDRIPKRNSEFAASLQHLA